MSSVFCRQSGQGPALVLFHGWGFDHQIWNTVRDELEPYYTLYCADLPGHGKTAPMLYNDFFTLLLQQLPDAFNLVGWSLGGIYAIKFASMYPENIRKMVNVCTSPCFLAQEDWPGIHSSVFRRFYQRYSANPVRTIQEFIRAQIHPPPPEIQIDFPIMGTDIETGLAILKQWDLRPELSELPMPVYFLLGKKDSIVPHKLAGKLSDQFAPIDVQVWHQSAHMPFVSEKSFFIEYIHKVLT